MKFGNLSLFILFTSAAFWLSLFTRKKSPIRIHANMIAKCKTLHTMCWLTRKPILSVLKIRLTEIEVVCTSNTQGGAPIKKTIKDPLWHFWALKDTTSYSLSLRTHCIFWSIRCPQSYSANSLLAIFAFCFGVEKIRDDFKSGLIFLVELAGLLQ